MKKLLKALLSVFLTVCLCIPFAACRDTQETYTKRKRIIGIDSDKTYLKSKIHLANSLDIIGKTLYLEFYSYDKIEQGELQGVSFDITSDSKYDLIAESYELNFLNYNDSKNYYRYRVDIDTYMRWAYDGVRINSVNLKISGNDYKFKTDIYCVMDTFRPVFVKPQTFGFNMLNAGKSVPYGQIICTKYDMTLKSLKFQTEGFEILSYEIETYAAPQTGTSEFITDKFPVTLEANKTYQINVEAIPPQDCLYYGFDFEAVVEINGVEMVYNNVDTIAGGDFEFMGSALNSLNAD